MNPRGYLINGNFYDENISDSKLDLVTPLYTEKLIVKEQLTDEDLEIITEALLMVGFMDDFVNYDLKEKALAILRKASDK